MKKINLSVVIITFNEEKNISRCLDSITEIADEIIVVDSFSTDRTKEICLNYNIKFVENSFKGHIEQKNFVLNLASNNFVLSLDADEVLSKNLNEEIKKIKADCRFDSYSFKRLTFFCGKAIKHCGWYPDKRIRLWDKTKGKWGGKNPHDLVKMQQNSTSYFINEDILHYSFNSIYEHLEQINKFSQIKADNLFIKNKKSNCFLILLSPFLKFIKSFYIKLGFLDGFYGLVISVNSAFSNFLKYSKLHSLNKGKKMLK